MKILIYGMQSSGASLLSWLLAQSPNSLAIIDLWSWENIPDFSDVKNVEHIIVKCCVSNKYSLIDHTKSFDPDIKILFIRHPEANFTSLKNKTYANESGNLITKFLILDNIDYKCFNLVIRYEDLVNNPSLVISNLKKIGVSVEPAYLSFKRNKKDIFKFNIEHSEWCKKYYKIKWGFGNIYFPPQLSNKSFETEKPNMLDRILLSKILPNTFFEYKHCSLTKQKEKKITAHSPLLAIFIFRISLFLYRLFLINQKGARN